MSRVWGVVHLTRTTPRRGTAGRPGWPTCPRPARRDASGRAYGDVDEANSLIGVALATAEMPSDIGNLLRLSPDELFDLGADLATRWSPSRNASRCASRRSTWTRLEPPATASATHCPTALLLLPGGTLAAAQLQLARTVVRVAERAGWSAVNLYGTERVPTTDRGGVNPSRSPTSTGSPTCSSSWLGGQHPER